MNNIQDVRTELSNVFEDLKNGKIKPSEASELNNTAGKIINSLKVEIEYYSLRKETPEIDYFKKK